MNRINPDEAINLPKSATCPYCNTKLDMTTGVSGNNPDNRTPIVGDISLCITCGEPCQFGTNMEMLELSEDELKEVLKDPMIAKARKIIKAFHATQTSKQHEYEQQLDKMLDGVRSWLDTNQGRTLSIQYNFNSETCVIASLDEALDKHFISVNDDASVMFKELGWLDDKPSMPTVLMVKMVMDRVFKEDE